jgi:ribonuclease T2
MRGRRIKLERHAMRRNSTIRAAGALLALLATAVWGMPQAGAQGYRYGGGGGQSLLQQVQYQPWSGSEPRARGGVPGRFDYYALVLSWSPTFCASDAARPGESQCRPRPRPFAFVLHGLWPQYERGYPEFCPTPDRPFVQQRTIDQMQDIMPSRNLVIHEYRKHGVCTGFDPERYYALARGMFEKVKIPRRFIDPADNQMVDTSAVVEEFVEANPGLRPEMLAVVCGGPGNRLREVRICYTPDGKFRNCGANENQRRLCSASRVFVPPVRLGRGADDQPRRGTPNRSEPMLPGPMLPGPVPPGQRNL